MWKGKGNSVGSKWWLVLRCEEVDAMIRFLWAGRAAAPDIHPHLQEIRGPDVDV
jgi:hypothetical protein